MKKTNFPTKDILLRTRSGHLECRLTKTVKFVKKRDSFLIYILIEFKGLKRSSVIIKPKKFVCHYAAVCYADVLLLETTEELDVYLKQCDY